MHFAFHSPMFERSIKASLMEAKCVGTFQKRYKHCTCVYLNLPLIEGNINKLVPYNRQV